MKNRKTKLLFCNRILDKSLGIKKNNKQIRNIFFKVSKICPINAVSNKLKKHDSILNMRDRIYSQHYKNKITIEYDGKKY